MSRGARTRPSTLVGAWVGNGLVTNFGDFESIASETVGSGGTSLVTFSSIPGTYKHLQLRFLARTNRALTSDNLLIRFNGVSSAAYSLHTLDGNGSTAYAYGSSSFETGILVSIVAAATASANVFGGGVFDILDYANTNKNKTIRFECQNFWLEMNLTVRFDKGLGVKVTCIYPNVNSEGNLKHAVNIIMEYYVMDYSEGKNPIDYSNVDKILDLIEVDE
jgi:hypothetical protein